jgi:hypothetical protein
MIRLLMPVGEQRVWRAALIHTRGCRARPFRSVGCRLPASGPAPARHISCFARSWLEDHMTTTLPRASVPLGVEVSFPSPGAARMAGRSVEVPDGARAKASAPRPTVRTERTDLLASRR